MSSYIIDDLIAKKNDREDVSFYKIINEKLVGVTRNHRTGVHKGDTDCTPLMDEIAKFDALVEKYKRSIPSKVSTLNEADLAFYSDSFLHIESNKEDYGDSHPTQSKRNECELSRDNITLEDLIRVLSFRKTFDSISFSTFFYVVDKI